MARSGLLRREPDPDDRRKQVLRPHPDGVRRVRDLFDSLRQDAATLVAGFDNRDSRVA